jgi:hypothetical protein
MAEVTAAEAAGTGDLGQAGRSLALYRQALDQAGCPRDRAAVASGLAHALASHGEHDQAMDIALDVTLPALEAGVASARCLDQLRQVAAAAGTLRRALELRNRIDAARQAIPSIPRTGVSAPTTLTSVPA